MNAGEQIDGSTANPAELRRAGIDALVKALGPVGMARFLRQFDPGQGDYTAERDRILGSPSVDEVMDELKRIPWVGKGCSPIIGSGTPSR